jgi:menaquinone-dependent protoporphyrinogen oxidase
MTVLVAHASAHGSTKQVAERIAERLRTSGAEVDLLAADDVEDASTYTAVVLGSAVHNGRWLTPASALLERIGERPRAPLWLFSVCTVGETSSFLGPRLSRLARERRPLPEEIARTGAPHRWFAGVIEPSHWNVLGRLFFLVTGGSYGDHRDWPDIERWADQIAESIAQRREP